MPLILPFSSPRRMAAQANPHLEVRTLLHAVWPQEEDGFSWLATEVGHPQMHRSHRRIRLATRRQSQMICVFHDHATTTRKLGQAVCCERKAWTLTPRRHLKQYSRSNSNCVRGRSARWAMPAPPREVDADAAAMSCTRPAHRACCKGCAPPKRGLFQGDETVDGTVKGKGEFFRPSRYASKVKAIQGTKALKCSNGIKPSKASLAADAKAKRTQVTAESNRRAARGWSCHLALLPMKPETSRSQEHLSAVSVCNVNKWNEQWTEKLLQEKIVRFYARRC